MFKGAAVKVFQHTHLPFYVILCNCEVNLLPYNILYDGLFWKNGVKFESSWAEKSSYGLRFTKM